MVEILKYTNSTKNILKNKLLSRNQLEYGNIQNDVNEILKNVKKNGDIALFSYTKKFDNFDLNKENIKISQEEIDEAYSLVDEKLKTVILKAIERIKTFHTKQKTNSWIEPDFSGETMGQLIRPIENVGVYVPGGKAFYPSSVLMNIIPAKIAGVKNIIMVSPPNKDGKLNPATIFSAIESGVTEIYKVGGAQSIAALAFSTESIPKVDKIVGPGNIYVALAKKSVYGYVNIDSVAGPSEILVIADETANPKFVAADLLSQAEHDELASSILITTSEKLANDVNKEIIAQMKFLSKKDIIEKSLNDFGLIIITDNLETATQLSNYIAPEHLEICVEDSFNLLNKIKNAGSIFLGNYSPEPLGDYMAGPNHVLPTSGTAKFFSPLSVDDFIKKSSVISFSKDALNRLADDIIIFAEAEGLTAHANSLKVRKDND